MRHIKLVLSQNEFDNFEKEKGKAEKSQKIKLSWEKFMFQKVVRRIK